MGAARHLSPDPGTNPWLSLLALLSDSLLSAQPDCEGPQTDGLKTTAWIAEAVHWSQLGALRSCTLCSEASHTLRAALDKHIPAAHPISHAQSLVHLVACGCCLDLTVANPMQASPNPSLPIGTQMLNIAQVWGQGLRSGACAALGPSHAQPHLHTLAQLHFQA